MKKIMFLTIVFGLMMVFSGNASAQKGEVDSITNDSQTLKPAAGEYISLIIATAVEDNSGIGVKKGSQFCVLSIRRGSDIASVFMNKNCGELGFTKFRHKITRVNNPADDTLNVRDKATIDVRNKAVAFSRGGEEILTIFFE